MIRKLILLAALLSALSAPASAGPLGASALDSDDLAWFYNRPGVTTEQIRIDHNVCQAFAAMMLGAGSPNPGSYGLAGDAIGAIASAGLNVAYVDDCMVSNGYRRFNIANTRLREFQARFGALSAEEQAAYFSAETPPEGVLARHWSNTYWLGAEGDAVIAGERRFAPLAMSMEAWNRASQPRWIRPSQAGAVMTPAANEAVVVFTLRSSTGNARFGFDRRTPEGDAAFIDVEGRSRWVGFEPRMEDAQGARAFAAAVPAGIYSLGYFGTRRGDVTTFCHGTIAFEAAAGQVIDLGDITIEAGGAVVDPMAPAPTARMRIDQPELAAGRLAAFGASAANAQPASYRNLFPRRCQLFSRTYGFEIPGAPVWDAPPDSNN